MPRGIAVPHLRKLRDAAVLTQAELAARAGVARNVVVRAENGAPVRASTARKLASALGVPPGVLVTRQADVGASAR